MAQIFVSHSSWDRELVDVLARVATKVRAIYEEFEAITQGPATAQRIMQHIAQANAVFVALGRSTRSFPQHAPMQLFVHLDRIVQAVGV
jgi:hypothetical protein